MRSERSISKRKPNLKKVGTKKHENYTYYIYVGRSSGWKSRVYFFAWQYWTPMGSQLEPGKELHEHEDHRLLKLETESERLSKIHGADTNYTWDNHSNFVAVGIRCPPWCVQDGQQLRRPLLELPRVRFNHQNSPQCPFKDDPDVCTCKWLNKLPPRKPS